MKLQTAKQNEKDVVNKLNKIDNHKFMLHPKKFSHYDIAGVMNDKFTIIEVKLRRQWFPDLWIEVEKIEMMFRQSAQEGFQWETGNKYLCCTHPDTGDHYFYDIDKIVLGNKVKRFMNKATAKGFNRQGKKVLKEVFEFKADSEAFIVSDNI